MIHPDMEQFLRFVERQPSDRRYQWENSDICACGQFADSIGVHNWPHRDHGGFWSKANQIAEIHPRTFGALADRIAHVIDEQKRGARVVRFATAMADEYIAF